MMRLISRNLILAFFPAALGVSLPAVGEEPSLRASLTFHTSFDHGPNADFARGDGTLYMASSTKREDARPGLPEGVKIAEGQGRHGHALHFTKKTDAVIFYRAAGNLPYASKDWSGTISFWLSLDPNTELDPGYADPIQITERAWNDAALWVDFSDRNPRHFRLGAFADFQVWNPNNQDFEALAAEQRPMFDAGEPPFAAGRWSHIVITFENFNTGRNDGVAALFIDGQRRGAVTGWSQTYTWDPDKAAVMLGLGYKGRLDELAIFDRALSDDEIRELHRSGGRLEP